MFKKLLSTVIVAISLFIGVSITPKCQYRYNGWTNSNSITMYQYGTYSYNVYVVNGHYLRIYDFFTYGPNFSSTMFVPYYNPYTYNPYNPYSLTIIYIYKGFGPYYSYYYSYLPEYRGYPYYYYYPVHRRKRHHKKINHRIPKPILTRPVVRPITPKRPPASIRPTKVPTRPVVHPRPTRPTKSPNKPVVRRPISRPTNHYRSTANKPVASTSRSKKN